MEYQYAVHKKLVERAFLAHLFLMVHVLALLHLQVLVPLLVVLVHLLLNALTAEHHVPVDKVILVQFQLFHL